MTITLPVTTRDTAKKAARVRAAGEIPAVVYGGKQESTAIAMDAKVFEKVMHEAGESTIIELTGLDKDTEVLIKAVDFNPIKSEVSHVDFYAVERGKEMTTHVALQFVGESAAEQTKVGVVNKVLHELEITCLPKDLPNHIDVDLSPLTDLESKILVKDLKVPKGVTVHAEDDAPVVVVNPIKEEVEEAPAAAEAATDDTPAESAETPAESE